MTPNWDFDDGPTLIPYVELPEAFRGFKVSKIGLEPDPEHPGDDRLWAMQEGDHLASVTYRANGEPAVSCSCKAEWSHPKGTRWEKMISIFESHVAYANKVFRKPD